MRQRPFYNTDYTNNASVRSPVENSHQRLDEILKQADARFAVNDYFQKNALKYTFGLVAIIAVSFGAGFMAGMTHAADNAPNTAPSVTFTP